MPLARQIQGPQGLRSLFGLQPEPGQTPDSTAFNDYLANIPLTNEQSREAGVIAGADARTDASMVHDLDEANAVRDARNRGYDGSYPLEDQANVAYNQRLKMLLLPKQMDLEASANEKEAARIFTAGQGQMDRESRERIAAGTQEASLNRVNTQQQAITSRAQQAADAKRSWLSKLFSPSKPAAPAAPVAAAGAPGRILMEAPNGEQDYVDPARVAEFEAKGARVVN